eukprot:2309390-Pyramimonas_sp.AAC.2
MVKILQLLQRDIPPERDVPEEGAAGMVQDVSESIDHSLGVGMVGGHSGAYQPKRCWQAVL